jgi:hypothetical protein
MAAKYDQAYQLYSEALAIDTKNKLTNAKLYFNRATVAAKVLQRLNVLKFIHFQSFYEFFRSFRV